MAGSDEYILLEPVAATVETESWNSSFAAVESHSF